jgi:hypothetical protein
MVEFLSRQAAEITSVPEHETELLALARESGLRAVKDEAPERRIEGIDPDELQPFCTPPLRKDRT